MAQFHLRLTHNISITTLNPTSIAYNYYALEDTLNAEL